jgi:hypothetical protein
MKSSMVLQSHNDMTIVMRDSPESSSGQAM